MLFQQTKVTVSFLEFPLTFYRHFLPYGRVDLTASASLQPIRGGLTTASWAAASPLQQPRLVNHPGCLNYL